MRITDLLNDLNSIMEKKNKKITVEMGNDYVLKKLDFDLSNLCELDTCMKLNENSKRMEIVFKAITVAALTKNDSLLSDSLDQFTETLNFYAETIPIMLKSIKKSQQEIESKLN